MVCVLWSCTALIKPSLSKYPGQAALVCWLGLIPYGSINFPSSVACNITKLCRQLTKNTHIPFVGLQELGLGKDENHHEYNPEMRSGGELWET